MDLNLCCLWLKNDKTPTKRLEIGQLKRRGPPRPPNIYFLLKSDFFSSYYLLFFTKNYHFHPSKCTYISISDL